MKLGGRKRHNSLNYIWLFLLIIGLSTSAHAAHFSSPTTTEKAAYFLGNFHINGLPAQSGDEVAFFDPQGVLCGHYVVSSPGEYGIVAVYGDDLTTAATDEGATAGDTLKIKIWDSRSGVELEGVDLELTPGTPLGSFASSSLPPIWRNNSGYVLNIDTSTHFPKPKSTPLVSNYLGNLTIKGQPAEIGDEIAVYDPDGIPVGFYSISTPGKYGIMAIYGDDPTTPSVDEGTQPGDNLAFKIWHKRTGTEYGGINLILSPGEPLGSFLPSALPPVWTEDTGYTLDIITDDTKYAIKVIANLHGSVAPGGEVPVDYGADQTFTITPELDYRVADVKIDGVSVGPVTTYTFSKVTAPHTIEAIFAINTHPVTVTSGPGGSISPSGEVQVNHGGEQLFTITPNEGYHLVDVKIDGDSAGAITTYTFLNVVSDHTIEAIFEINTYIITATSGAGGSLSPSGAVTVTHGSNQTFIITPSEGYQVAGIRVDGVSAGAQTSYTFHNVTSNHRIEVIFAVNSYPILVMTGSGGSISPSGKIMVNQGSDQSFTITPDQGYYLSDVKVDDLSLGPVTTYTFYGVTTFHTIETVFGKNNYPLTVSKSGAGNGVIRSNPAGIDCDPDCFESFNFGTSVTLTAIPDENSTFLGWSGTCTGKAACTVVIDSAKEVVASWSVVVPTLDASFVIAEGDLVKSPKITLNLNCKNCDEYIVSENTLFTGASFQPFVSVVPFLLSSGDGPKTVYVQVRQNNGNTSAPASANVRLDTTGPVIVMTNPVSGAVIKRPVSIDINLSDPSGLLRSELYIDSILVQTETTTSYSYAWNVLSEVDGGHELKVMAYDTLGNATTLALTVTVSKSPPQAPVITAPISGTITISKVQVIGTAEPNSTVALFNNSNLIGRAIAEASGNFQFLEINLAEGSNLLSATATDRAGTSPQSQGVLLVVDTGPPPAPAFYQPVSLIGGKIKLNWSPGLGETAASYRLYRSTTPFTTTAEAVLVKDGLTTNNFEDLPPFDGLYYYRLTALDGAGNESALSGSISAQSDREPPSARIVFNPQSPVGPGNVAITLSITEPVSGAPYLSLTPAGGSSFMIELTKNSETEWSGLYQIVAATPSGTAILNFSAKDLLGNKGTTVVSGSNLEIDTMGPAGSLNISPLKNIYKAGIISLALTLNELPTMAPILRFQAPAGSTTEIPLTGNGTSWTGSLEIMPTMGNGNGVFLMEAMDPFGNAGSKIISGNFITLDTTPPAPPGNLTADSLPGGKVKLAWESVQDAGSYNLYRVSSGGVLQLPATPLVANLHVTNYLDLPENDGAYHYGVTALDQAGNESPLSTGVPAVSDRVAPGAPGNLALSLVGDSVRISWTAPGGEGAASYSIYRSSEAIVSILGLTPILKGLTASEASDVPPADGRYYYAVTALDAAGNESEPSTPADITYDLAPPVITVTGVKDGEFKSGQVTPVITVTDVSLESVAATLNGITFTSGTAVTEEKRHILHIEARDTSQRTSVAELTFTIDLTDPVIEIPNVSEGKLYEAALTPVINVTDTNLDATTVTLNGQPYQTGTPINTDGVKTLRVEASDKAGRTSVLTVHFNIDTAPPPLKGFSIVADQDGKAVLTWQRSGEGDLAGYYIYKNGTRLNSTPLTEPAFTDLAFNSNNLEQYGLTAIDNTGHESVPVEGMVYPVLITLKSYGTTGKDGFVLSKQYIESLQLELKNNHSDNVRLGPVSYELRDHLDRIGEITDSVQFTMMAGEILSKKKVFAVGSGIVDYRTFKVSLTFPESAEVSVTRMAAFNLNATDPGRKIEVFNEPIIKGGLAKVSIKIYNHGSAPIVVLTSVGDQPSSEVYVLLKDMDGNILAKGNLYQKGFGVIDYSGYSLAEIQPGRSFLSGSIEFLVPSSVPDKVYLEAIVTNTYYHYQRPEQITGGSVSGYTNATVSQAPYYATITPERPVGEENTPLVLNGEALDVMTGLPVANVQVKIGISVKGFDRYITATTDDLGKFSIAFTPLVGEAGKYIIWATHPSVFDKPVQSSFQIYGLAFQPRSINLRMSKNSSFTIPVTIRNLGEAPITDLAFTFNGGEGVTGLVDTTATLTSLEGGGSTSVKVIINAATEAPDASSAMVILNSAEGITRKLDISLALLPALPTVVTEPNYLEAGLTRNSSKVMTFKLKNVGFAPFQNLRIEGPSLAWIGITSERALPPLAPGESLDIGVIFRPTDNVAQGVHSDKLIISSTNHVPYVFNLFATVTSNNKGGVHFQATDALNQRVQGASVIAGHQLLGNIILSGTTDGNGEISFDDIPEGMYNYKVQAPGHEIVIGNFEIVPDVITTMDVFLNNVFVTYEWSVTPMTFTDKYDIKLEATYQTNVPAPVITIDPAYEKLEMEIGSTYAGEYKVTNHGLVAIDNVRISSNYAPGLKVEVLVPEIPRIGAKETVLVPYRVTLNQYKSPEPVDPCSEIPMTVNVAGVYICAFGTEVELVAPSTKTIIPKERYDVLGLCDAKCDWCDCLPGPASSLCKCLREGDLCSCVGVLGEDVADVICECGTSDDIAACLIEKGKDALLDVIPVVSSIKSAFDLIKTGVNCVLCLLDLIPPLPPSPPGPPSSGGSGGGGSFWGGYGGGGYGGAGSIAGGGISFSGGGCKK